MNNAIDLSQLPAPNIIEPLDYETLLAERKARLVALYSEEEREAITELLALESEPTVKLLQENAYRELLLRQRINEAARAVMLPYAMGADLDNVAAQMSTGRLVIDPGDPAATPPVPPTLESDAALRIRAQAAWEGLSSGTRMGYEHAARSADGRVRDVRALSPAPAEALVVVLSHEGDGVASAELLGVVETRLLDDDGPRIIGDRLTVQSAEIIEYEIDAVLHLYDDAGPTAELTLEEARRRTGEFVQMHHRLGRPLGVSVYRDAIKAAIHAPGVMHVELTQPAEHVLTLPTQAARCTGVKIALGGGYANG